MRHVSYAIVLVVLLWSGWVGAQPKVPGRPNAAQQTELDKLQKDLTDQQIKQTTFAAARTARKLYELERKIYGDTATETLSRLVALAGLLQQIGDYPGALAAYQQNLTAVEKTKGPEAREVLYALNYLTGPYMVQGRYDELEPIQQRALALTKKLDGENSMAYAGALQMSGMILQMRNEHTSAIRVYEEALKLREAIAKSKDDMTVTSAMQVLGSAYFQAGQQQKAIALYDRLIALVTSSKDATPQMLAGTLWGIAAQYHYGGRPDLAVPLRKKVMDIFLKEIANLEKTKPDDWMLSSLFGQLAFQYREQGDLVNAEKMFMKSIALDEKQGRFSSWAGSLADIKRASGKPKEALALLEKAQAELTKTSPMSSTAYAGTIGDVLRETGDFKRSEQVLSTYLANLEKTYGKRHPIYGMGQLSLARLYMASNRPRDAEQVLTSSLESAERDLSLVLKTGTEADHAIYFSRNNYLASYCPIRGTEPRA